MEPQIDHIKELMRSHGWNESKLARQMGISRSEVNRFLKGKRNAGKKVIDGLIKAFPNEPVEALFFFEAVSPIVNVSICSKAKKEQSGDINTRRIKHPKAHQLACTIDETDGRIDIRQGKFLTTLTIPPGKVDVSFSNT